MPAYDEESHEIRQLEISMKKNIQSYLGHFFAHLHHGLLHFRELDQLLHGSHDVRALL
jgi:hypothetical protein